MLENIAIMWFIKHGLFPAILAVLKTTHRSGRKFTVDPQLGMWRMKQVVNSP